MERLRNLPVYKLRPKTGTGRVRTLHRDHLLPIRDSLRIPALSGEEDTKPPVTRAQTVKKKQLREKVDNTNEHARVEMSSDSDDDIGYYVPDRHCTHYCLNLLPKKLHTVLMENSYSNTELELEELPKEGEI